MIIYVDKRLQLWARWRSQGRVLPMIARPSWHNLVPVGTEGKPAEAFVPLNDVECKDVDTCVCALRPDLAEAVIAAYCRIGTVETAARAVGVSKATLFRKLDLAHYQILGWLNDLAAGIPVPAWSAPPAGHRAPRRPERITAVVLPELPLKVEIPVTE